MSKILYSLLNLFFQWLQWHQAAPVLLVGTSDGQVWMWKIPSGDCKTFVGFGPAALCGQILPDGNIIFISFFIF